MATDKKPTTIRLSDGATALLALIAKDRQTSRTAILEQSLRDWARHQGYETPKQDGGDE